MPGHVPQALCNRFIYENYYSINTVLWLVVLITVWYAILNYLHLSVINCEVVSCTDTALISRYEVFFQTLTCWKSGVHVDCYSNVTVQDFISVTPTGKLAYGSLNFLTTAPIYHVNVEPLSKCDKWPETTAHTPLHSPSKWLVEI